MRYYSRFVALQIKAAILGMPLQVYDRKFPIRAVDQSSKFVNGGS